MDNLLQIFHRYATDYHKTTQSNQTNLRIFMQTADSYGQTEIKRKETVFMSARYNRHNLTNMRKSKIINNAELRTRLANQGSSQQLSHRRR